ESWQATNNSSSPASANLTESYFAATDLGSASISEVVVPFSMTRGPNFSEGIELTVSQTNVTRTGAAGNVVGTGVVFPGDTAFGNLTSDNPLITITADQDTETKGTETVTYTYS